MESDEPQPVDAPEATGLPLAVSLTAIAGYVDAVAFVRFGGLFVSFMSGNTTKLAAAPVLARAGEGALAAGVVALFVMGAFAGRLVHEAAGVWRRPALLSLTAGLLCLATFAGGLAAGGPASAATLGVAVGAMTLAMGAMNAALTRVGNAKVAATYVTGVLVHLGDALAERAMGRPSPWPVYGLAWFGLVLGAALGAQAAVALGMVALAIPTAFVALLALAAGDLVRRAQVRRAS